MRPCDLPTLHTIKFRRNNFIQKLSSGVFLCCQKKREASVYNVQYGHHIFPFLSGSLLAFACLCFTAKMEISFMAMSKHNPAVEWSGCQHTPFCSSCTEKQTWIYLKSHRHKQSLKTRYFHS